MFIPMLLMAAPLLILSSGSVSPIRAWADGIWKILNSPAVTVKAKRCHTSRRSSEQQDDHQKAHAGHYQLYGGQESVLGEAVSYGPANRARKFKPMRAKR